jgi:predicted nucleic acid-binding protein
LIYLDSSSLLKLLWPEPESGAVRLGVAAEDVVIISSLTELETEIQLKAAWLAGRYRAGRWRRFREKLTEFRQTEPFQFHRLGAPVFEAALRQHRAGGRIHCRTLDRLHLAAMEELRVRRLMTNDASQAEAARAMDLEVLTPGIIRFR